MWTPAGYMKQNKTEYRLFATKFNGSESVLLMVTWDKERAEQRKDELTKMNFLCNLEIQEAAL